MGREKGGRERRSCRGVPSTPHGFRNALNRSEVADESRDSPVFRPATRRFSTTEHFSPRFLETNEIRFHADPSSMLIVRPFSHACKDGIELRPPAIKRYDIAPIYYLKRTPVRNNTSVKSVICISLQMYSVYQLAGTLVKRVFLSLSLSFPYPS